MYYLVFDDTCPYYLENGKCELGASSYEECDDAYTALGDEWGKDLVFDELFAVYNPDLVED